MLIKLFLICPGIYLCLSARLNNSNYERILIKIFKKC